MRRLPSYKRKSAMLPANKDQALHKAIMIRVLIKILDDTFLSQNMFFKGGTCASMLGYLDRFSVDLDFDIKSKEVSTEISKHLEEIFTALDLETKDRSKNVLQYYLKYDAPAGSRNTLKIDAVDVPYNNNNYENMLLPEINRYATCQTKETLFTNKLVALVDRFDQHNAIAGRDLYDIHYFLKNGFGLNEELVVERRGVDIKTYLKQLIEFIDKHITQTVINQDLNFLLEYKKFNAIRQTLKEETIVLLRDRLD